MIESSPASRPAFRTLAWAATGVMAWAAVAAVSYVNIWYIATGNHFPDRTMDLHIYAGAVRHLAHTGDLYGYTTPDGGVFTYPPFAGLLLLPLAVIQEPVLQYAWTVAQLIETVVLAALVVGHTRHPLLARVPRPVAVPAVASLLLISNPIYKGLYFGQISLLLALMVVMDVLVVPRRWQGVLTGLASAVKLTPLVFIPYLWLSGRRRAAGVAAATFTAATALAWAVLPHDSALYWLHRIFDVSLVGEVAHVSNQSLAGLLGRFGWTGAGREATLLLAIAVVVVLGYLRAARADRAGDPLAGVVIVGAVAVIVSPISWDHHQVLVVVAAACWWFPRDRGLNVVASVTIYFGMTVAFEHILTSSVHWVQLLIVDEKLVVAVLVACVLPTVRAGRPVPDRPFLPGGPGTVKATEVQDEVGALP